jgi:AraC-like DNA-binding protein
MPTKGAWLEPHYSLRLVRPFVEAMRRVLGTDTTSMNRLLDQADDARITVRTAVHLLDSAVALTHREDLGLLAAEGLDYGSCDVLQFAAASAPDWGCAVENILRYIRILNESAQFTLTVRDGIASIELRSSIAPHRAASDFQVGALAKAARAWLGSLKGFDLWFAHAEPADIASYEAAFCEARLRFRAPVDALVFDASKLRQAMPSADPKLHEVMRRHADYLLSLVPDSPSLVPRVRSVLSDLLANGDTDAAKVASRLGMSRRSLTRHLEHENITYSELLEQLRHELALSYLQKTDHDVQEIAFLLGYSLTAAFSRAFRRWEGKSPIAYWRSLVPPARKAAALAG